MTFTQWKVSAIGRAIDVDNAYGDQCVDVLMDYAQAMFPGHGWPELLGHGNAKDLFASSNAAFFQKIVNNVNDPNQLPQQGDMMIFDATPTNAFGHCGICDSADSGGVNLIQQDGSLNVDAQGNAHNPCVEVYRAWTRSHCIGWLRPILQAAPAPAPAPTATLLPYQRVIGANGVNYRDGASTSANIIKAFNAGDTLDFKGFVHGENYSGNDIWFVGRYTGGYAWSGAFVDTSTNGLVDLTPAPVATPTPAPVAPVVTPVTPTYSQRPSSGLFIIDVSQFQKDIDWNSLKGVIDGAILHVGHVGASFGGNENCTDNKLVANQTASRAIGLEPAYYYYVYFSEDPLLEAHRFTVGIGNLLSHESLWVDIEEQDANEAWLWTFVNAVEAATGKRVNLYTYTDFANNHAWLANFKKDGRVVWIANYVVAPEGDVSGTPLGSAVMHQYTSKGTLLGITTNVDLNRFDGTIDDWRAIGNSFVAPTVTPVVPLPNPSPTPVVAAPAPEPVTSHVPTPSATPVVVATPSVNVAQAIVNAFVAIFKKIFRIK